MTPDGGSMRCESYTMYCLPLVCSPLNIAEEASNTDLVPAITKLVNVKPGTATAIWQPRENDERPPALACTAAAPTISTSL